MWSGGVMSWRSWAALHRGYRKTYTRLGHTRCPGDQPSTTISVCPLSLSKHLSLYFTAFSLYISVWMSVCICTSVWMKDWWSVICQVCHSLCHLCHLISTSLICQGLPHNSDQEPTALYCMLLFHYPPSCFHFWRQKMPRYFFYIYACIQFFSMKKSSLADLY